MKRVRRMSVPRYRSGEGAVGQPDVGEVQVAGIEESAALVAPTSTAPGEDALGDGISLAVDRVHGRARVTGDAAGSGRLLGDNHVLGGGPAAVVDGRLRVGHLPSAHLACLHSSRADLV